MLCHAPCRSAFHSAFFSAWWKDSPHSSLQINGRFVTMECNRTRLIPGLPTRSFGGVEHGMGVAGEVAAEVGGVSLERPAAEPFVVAQAEEGTGEQ